MALGVGVTTDQAAAIATWREEDLFSPVERLVLTAAEAVHEMTVTDDLFSELEAELGQAGATELIVVISQYEAVARIIQALGVEVDADHQHHLVDWTPV